MLRLEWIPGAHPGVRRRMTGWRRVFIYTVGGRESPSGKEWHRLCVLGRLVIRW